MLKAHLSAIEKAILCQSAIQATAGHSLHKGSPREIFIKSFLQCHNENVSFGTGEIIDSSSKPGEHRNQIDTRRALHQTPNNPQTPDTPK